MLAGLAVFALALAIVLAMLPANPAHAAFPGRNGRIAFEGGLPFPAPQDIFSIEPTGKHERRLTHNPPSDGDPAYSPNGKKIAFDSDRKGLLQIFVMSAAGKGQRRVTKNSDACFDPAWSPNGRRIVFTRSHLGHGKIYTMNADGTHQRKRTHLDANTFGATWSPNGKRIAFYSSADGDFEVYAMNVNGSHLRQLTHNSTFDGNPNYAPNGRHIVFGDATGIARMKPGGGHVKQLSTNTDSEPAYSPNGKKIAFERLVAGMNFEIFTMNADGTKQRRRTHNSRVDFAADWQPLPR